MQQLLSAISVYPLVFKIFEVHARVFLIGTHPEIEEDSNRDEVTFGGELNDEGSEWYIMQKVVFWLLEES